MRREERDREVTEKLGEQRGRVVPEEIKSGTRLKSEKS